jgi:hypothetical protein
MIKAIDVKAVKKYVIQIKFEDGVSGEVDLSADAGKGVFKFWDEGDAFFHVYINSETDGIAWSDMLEISPERVYEELVLRTKAA